MLPLWARVNLGTMAMKGVLHLPQSPSINGTSPWNCLVSYLGHSLGGCLSPCILQPQPTVQIRFAFKTWMVQHIASYVFSDFYYFSDVSIIGAQKKTGSNICLSKNKVKLATLVEDDPRTPFSIATTQRCRRGRYSIPWIAPLYFWSVPYNTES